MKKPTREVFEKLADGTGGNLAEMARRIGCSRTILYKWVEKDPKMKEIIEDARESALDLAESRMMKLIQGVPEYVDEVDEETGRKSKRLNGWRERPDSTLIMFFLKTRGKKRGYDQSNKPQEEENNNNREPHVFTVYDPATKQTLDLTSIGAAKEYD